MQIGKSIFNHELADQLPDTSVSKQSAETIFRFFQRCPLFRWQDANNDCEDRANAACILLQQWGIPNCKAWAFGGAYLNKDNGNLINNWCYHVAAAVPGKENDSLVFYVLDPATLKNVDTVEHWADQITDNAHSHYFIKSGDVYIFNPSCFDESGWHRRNSQNYKWTMQGLAGINGVSKKGKAQLVFNKKRIAETEKKFRQLLNERPLQL